MLAGLVLCLILKANTFGKGMEDVAQTLRHRHIDLRFDIIGRDSVDNHLHTTR
jgi:hypothetical protein